jgi:hypothetical protein
MEKSELTKQFQATLYEDEILITTPSNPMEAFEGKLDFLGTLKICNYKSHPWIATEDTALNYQECCGILILFGITPPSFEELYNLLDNAKTKTEFQLLTPNK